MPNSTRVDVRTQDDWSLWIFVQSILLLVVQERFREAGHILR